MHIDHKIGKYRKVSKVAVVNYSQFYIHLKKPEGIIGRKYDKAVRDKEW